MDEVICSIMFSIKKDILNPPKEMLDEDGSGRVTRWVNCFGCNPDYSNKAAQKQNEDVNAATTFKGRVLVQYYAVDEKHPTFKI